MITPRLTYFIFLISVFYGFTPAVVLAQRGNQQAGTGTFHNTVPAHPYDILVCRPTSNSVTLSILADFEGTGKLTYGPGPNPSGVSSEPFALKPGKPVLVVLKNLKANTRYVYSFDYTQNNGTWTQAPAGHFQTGRNVNTPYVFKLQADSHLDENTSPGMYVQTLKNMAADSADFLVDLGDTWMTDKYRENFRESEKQYIAQRY
jgi:hypothetical protein